MAVKKRISFLGPEGTFTEEALLKYIGDSPNIDKIAYPTIIETIKSVDQGNSEEGIVPIENSIEGSVNITLDILTFESEAKVIREITIPIRHYLISKKETDFKKIKRIISHPHASAQCRNFLSTHFAGINIEAANSTAEAVKRLISLDEDAAAIGTHISASLYDLKIIADDIESNKDNKTRFVFLGNHIPQKTGNDKTSIVCFLKKDKPGSLFNILKEFAEREINLTRLESRPAKKDLGDYVFMIDLEGHIHDKKLYEAIENLRKKVYLVKILGSYNIWKDDLERR